MRCRTVLGLALMCLLCFFVGSDANAQLTDEEGEAFMALGESQDAGYHDGRLGLAERDGRFAGVFRDAYVHGYLKGKAEFDAKVAATVKREAAECAAMHNAPKVPDKDGKGWTQRDGKKLRGSRDGVVFKIERIGKTDFYENDEGSTGTRTYDDFRKVSRYMYTLPARGFKIAAEDPYAENKKFKAWHKVIALKKAGGSAPAPARTVPQPSFVQVGPYMVPVAAFGLPR